MYFWAHWCQPCKQLDEVFAELAKDSQQATFIRVGSTRVQHDLHCLFFKLCTLCCCMHLADCLCYQVEAEEVPDVTDRYGVTVVPYFLIVKVLSEAALLIPSQAKISPTVNMQNADRALVARCGSRQERDFVPTLCVPLTGWQCH